jgi:hypothetical protein
VDQHAEWRWILGVIGKLGDTPWNEGGQSVLHEQFKFYVADLLIRLVEAKELVYGVCSASAEVGVDSAQGFASLLVECDDFTLIDGVVLVEVGSYPVCGH